MKSQEWASIGSNPSSSGSSSPAPSSLLITCTCCIHAPGDSAGCSSCQRWKRPDRYCRSKIPKEIRTFAGIRPVRLPRPLGGRCPGRSICINFRPRSGTRARQQKTELALLPPASGAARISQVLPMSVVADAVTDETIEVEAQQFTMARRGSRRTT